MNEIEILKEQVCEHGINTLLKRMETLLDSSDLRKLIQPMIVSAEITNMEEVVNIIKSKYTCFDIKDVKLNLSSQTVSFRIYGSCYVPKEYIGYVLLTWSATQTEECNYLKTIEEKYAEKESMPLSMFTKGIKIEII